MRKIKIFSFKVFAICFMMGFGIFFALDVANKGMEPLHPPAKESKSQSTAVPAAAAMAAPRTTGAMPAIITTAAPGTKGVLPATTPGAQAKESKQQQSTVSPAPTARSGVTAATAREAAAADAVKAVAVKNPSSAPPVVLQESFFNRLSNGIGGLLRSVAEATVRFVVSIFASILG